MSNITEPKVKERLLMQTPRLTNGSGDKVFYEYDYKKGKYKFITPTVVKLLGFNIDELNEIDFNNLVVQQLEENKISYSLNGESEGLKIEETIITYQIETKNREHKWIEDNSFTICDHYNYKITRIGLLLDVSEFMREEKLKQIILEILEAANSEKNLNELFRFIHASIKKLMKADNFYIAYYKRDSNLLKFPYFVDEIDNDSSSKKLGKGLTEYVLRTGKSALVNLEKDKELRRKGEVELIGPQSPIWLGVPLKIVDKTIGVMVVQDYSDPTTYGPAQQQILDVISYPISRAIERKMVEEEREEMIVKLKEMNTSKDRLFSLISHDLRAPFNSLLGFAEILRTEFESLTHRDIKEYLSVINDSSKTLYEMTNNLLHYSKIQLNKYDYVPQKILLNEIISEAIESLKYRMNKKSIHVKMELIKDYNIVADEEMMKIAFENLISNAIKFSNKGSVVKIFAEEVKTSDSDALTVQVSITDEGIGISEKNQQLINSGEVFSTPGTVKEPGSGLGLLISKNYILLNNGKFEIISSAGEGTTVVITLPSLKTG